MDCTIVVLPSEPELGGSLGVAEVEVATSEVEVATSSIGTGSKDAETTTGRSSYD
jgi:hypothetical protein